MVNIEEKKLENIKGGGISIWGGIGITAGVIFLIGIIDGCKHQS